MKKLLLSIVAVATMTLAHAQGNWSTRIVSVADTTDFYAGAVSVDDNGNVYAAGALTATSVEFGSTTLEPIGTASYLAKYDNAGNASWAVALQGATTVTAITSDADYVYVAGKFAGEAQLTSTDGNNTTINGMEGETDQYSAFIAKYAAADGKLVASKAFIPQAAVADGYEHWSGNAYIAIDKIQATDDKVYIVAAYQSVVTIDNLTLSSPFANLWGVMLMPSKSEVVLAMDANLANTEKIAEVAATENMGMNQVYPEDMNFVVNGSDIYLAFVGVGNLTLNTANGSKDYTFVYDGMGTAEHGMGVAKISEGAETMFVTYNAPANTVSATYHTIGDMICDTSAIYMSGTFHSAHAFDSTLVAQGACDIYVASLAKDNLAVNWVCGNNNVEGDIYDMYEEQTGMVVNGTNEVVVTGYSRAMGIAATIGQDLTYDVYDGSMSAVSEDESLGATIYALAGNDDYNVALNYDKATLSYNIFAYTKDDEEMGGGEVVVSGSIFSDKSWEKSTVSVADTTDFYAGAVSVDDNGNVYAAGALTATSVEFGSTTLEPIGTASYLAKYDNAGNASWAVALQGATTVTAITSDADYVYVAGKFAGEAQLTSTDGNNTTINGMEGETDQYSAFIAKYAAADGKLVASKAFIPQAAVADGYEHWSGNAYIAIDKIQATDDKVYIVAAYQSVVTIDNLTLSSPFANLWGVMLMPSKSEVVLAMDANLANTEKIAEVAATENMGMNQVYPEDMNFVVNGSDIYLAFVGVGNLTLNTANGSKDYTFVYDGMGTAEHGMGVAKISEGAETMFVTYNAPANTVSATYHTIGDIIYHEGAIYMSGTYHSAHAFDSTLVAQGACDIYVAALSDNDLSVNWVCGNDNLEGDIYDMYEVQTGLAVYGPSEVVVTGYSRSMGIAATIGQNLTYNVFRGMMNIDRNTDAIGTIYDLANAGTVFATLSHDKATCTDILTVYGAQSSGIENVTDEENGIEFIDGQFVFTSTTDAQIFDITGRCVKAATNVNAIGIDELGRGCYILKAGNNAIKFMK